MSTVLDEAMFWAAATKKKGFCLAAELNVRFITKVSVGQRMLCVARLKTDRGRLWESEGELRDEQGNVCVRGTCKQVPMDLSAMKDAALDFLPDPSTAEGMKLFTDLGPG